MTSKNSFPGEVADLKKGTENAIVVVGGFGPLNSSEALLFDRACALPDLPVPIYGPAVIMTEGPNGTTVVSDHHGIHRKFCYFVDILA